MRILMVTNTFMPHVGGVARSIQQFSQQYRELGHEVIVVAPYFADTPREEEGVVRIPAIQNFNGTDFSVPTPIPTSLWQRVDQFQPDVVHSHHPFLLGDTALRIGSMYNVPVVFTHHTQYERYTHYVPGDCEAMKRFVVDLAVGYCNLCDAVVAPSRTIQERLERLGVDAPIVEIPTGVDLKTFGSGDGSRVRKRLGIPADAFVVGHVGRLAPEKGLAFLASAVAKFLVAQPNSHFLVAGSGPSKATIRQVFADHGLTNRLILLGTMERPELADVYAAMNIFAFSSQSETQGMVLTEAMAAGTPVVAVDASGVREVLQDRANGLMLPHECEEDFVAALNEYFLMSPVQKARLTKGARRRAGEFSIAATATRALALYRELITRENSRPKDDALWSTARRRLAEEFKIWTNIASAATHAVMRVSVEEQE